MVGGFIGGGYGTAPEDKTTAFAFEQLAVSNSVVPLTSTVYSPTNAGAATRAVITCETNDMRYRYDGTSPSATVGMYLKAGDPLVIEGPQNIVQFRIIRVSADGVVDVTYER